MKKTLFCLVIVLCGGSLYSQIITTIAGTGVAGYSGDGGLATDAKIWSPSGVFVDRVGSIYISDGLNNRIRKINTSGIITTIAGNGYNPGGHGGYSGDGGPAIDAELYNPQSICTDALGNVYIADYGNNRIRKVSTAGIITTIAGNGNPGFGGDGGPATNAEIWAPSSICFDTVGNLYVADAGNSRIRKINTSGIITTVVGGGTIRTITNGIPATSVQFGQSYGVLVDDSGNIFASLDDPSQVFKVDKAGNIYLIAGIGTFGYSGDGGPAITAKLFEPAGVCLDASENVYISDVSNNRVRKINHSTGIISTVAGDSTGGYNGDGELATEAELGGPADVFIDAFNNLYITDYYNYRVRKVTNVTGINSIKNNLDITIFPNPTSSKINIQFAGTEIGIASISILDITGRKIINYQLFPVNSQFVVDISTLASGMYFISISVNGVKYTQKFVKM